MSLLRTVAEPPFQSLKNTLASSNDIDNDNNAGTAAAMADAC
jgi:hypothetical protein